jgi:hypothetical protein
MRLAFGIELVEPASDAPAERRRLGLRWWRELLYALAFYLVYSAIRNQFGSASVSPSHALEHAQQIIDLERALHLFFEEQVQSWFVTVGPSGQLEYPFTGAKQFIEFWNVSYGTFHFAVTAFAMVWLYVRFPRDYPTWRNTLALTTTFALIGFSFYPLMPPRLLTDCGAYGACLAEYSFVDTLADVGGLWSFDSGTMQKVSNQYAAMPSLHFGWSAWSAAVLYPRLRRRWLRALVLIYPVATVWGIVVTANHYWIDALGGAVILGAGYFCGSRLARRLEVRRTARITVDLGREHAGLGGSASPDGDAHADAGSMVARGSSGYRAQSTERAIIDTERSASASHVPRDDQQPG